MAPAIREAGLSVAPKNGKSGRIAAIFIGYLDGLLRHPLWRGVAIGAVESSQSGLSGMKSKGKMSDAAQRALSDPTSLRTVWAYGLNVPRAPTRETFFGVEDWTASVTDQLPERDGDYIVGFVPGGSSSITAAEPVIVLLANGELCLLSPTKHEECHLRITSNPSGHVYRKPLHQLHWCFASVLAGIRFDQMNSRCRQVPILDHGRKRNHDSHLVVDQHRLGPEPLALERLSHPPF